LRGEVKGKKKREVRFWGGEKKLKKHELGGPWLKNLTTGMLLVFRKVLAEGIGGKR